MSCSNSHFQDTPTHVQIASGSVTLTATLYRPVPKDIATNTVVLVNGALGMRRDFYRPFAHFLANNGFDALCWDYRGTGDSFDGSIARTKAYLHDWGEEDLPRVIDWLSEKFPRHRLVIVAHSVGGQILGMTPRTNLAERIALIASQSGYIGLWPKAQRWRIEFIRRIVLPTISMLKQPFPGRYFGMNSDISTTIMQEWADWNIDPDYFMGRKRRASAQHYQTIDRPMLNVWISDDDLASFEANRKMLTWYPNAHVQNWQLDPEDLGVKRIGHFRLFGQTIGPRFWPRLVSWLNTTVPT